jgi:diguanylate cyclase (GGDEF)-like protein/PAS domain S-box-containing protein
MTNSTTEPTPGALPRSSAPAELFRQITNSLNEILIVLDTDLNIVLLNQAALRAYNVTCSDYAGRPCHEIFWDCDQQCADCPSLEVMQHGTTLEAKRHRDDGTILDRTISAVYDDNGNITGCLIVAADITTQERYIQKMQRYEQILSTTTDMVAFLDTTDTYLAVNSSYAHDHNVTPDEIIGSRGEQIMPPEFYALYRSTLQSVLDCAKTVTICHDEIMDETIRRRLESMFIPYFESDDSISGVVVRTKDVTEEHKQQSKLRLAAQVFENTDEAIIITAPDTTILAVNAAFSHITGYSENEVINATPALLQSERHGKDFYASMLASLQQVGHWQGEVWNKSRSGESFPVFLKISAVKDHGIIVNYVGIFSDLSPTRKHAQELDFLAHHHPLTQLPNRRALNKNLADAVEKALTQKHFCAILYIDLDNFKKVNDSLGHDAGNQVLIDVATCLKNLLNTETSIYHISADEFVVTLPRTCNLECAIKFAKSIVDKLKEPFYVEGYELFLSASIGIAKVNQDTGNHDDLIKHADLAMYHAKKRGKDTYHIYTPELTAAALKRVKLESYLRRALELNELYVQFQPQIDLHQGRVVSAEALLRWKHPELGMIPPDVFIPLSEESGMIIQLGAFVLEHACRKFMEWRRRGLDIERIAVNVSGNQIQRRDLPDTVARILRETGCPPECLELEITESFIMHHPQESIELLDQICALGVTFSIDDFGTGHSCLSYLKKLPVKRLKIDRSFVWDINTNSDGEQLTRAVIAIGNSLNLQITAEGVETTQQLDFLIREKCDEVQGFLFSKPVGAEDFARLLERGIPDSILQPAPPTL